MPPTTGSGSTDRFTPLSDASTLKSRKSAPILRAIRLGLKTAAPGLDFLFIFIAFITAYYLRFKWPLFTSFFPIAGGEAPTLTPYIQIAVFAAGLWVSFLWRELVYKPELQLSRSFRRRAETFFLTGLQVMVFVVIVSFSFRYFLLSRLVYLIGFGMAFCMLVLLRALLALVDKRLEARGIICDRILLIGNSRAGQTITQEIAELHTCAKVVGRLEFGNEEGRADLSKLRQVASHRSLRDFEKLYRESPFNHVVIANLAREGEPCFDLWRETLLEILNFCEAKEIRLYMVPDLLEIAVRRRDIGAVGGIPLIALRDSALHPAYSVVKRVMDVCLSCAVILLGMPVWLLIAALVKIGSRGPVFYIQRRVGLHGKPFYMYKFRSMVQDADKRLNEFVDFDSLIEPVFNIREDPRVTRLGKFLRRTSLDEIPQFLNVLGGSMSIVGPRPERVELFERYNEYQKRRIKTKPGITGYQQVMSRGDPSLARRIEYDLIYLHQQSLFLDLYIMCKTVMVVIRGDGTK